jgi:hypothetical protein
LLGQEEVLVFDNQAEAVNILELVLQGQLLKLASKGY